jgi:hypothetical protein
VQFFAILHFVADEYDPKEIIVIFRNHMSPAVTS